MAETETTEPAKLGRGNLRLADVVAQAVGFMGPGLLGHLLPDRDRRRVPDREGRRHQHPDLADPGGDRHARRRVDHLALREADPRRGSLYDYVTAAFGRRAGFVAGWTYYGGMTALTLAIGLAFGGFLSLTLSINHDIDIGWYWLAIAFWIVAGAIMVFGVQISTRLQLILALVSMIVILALRDLRDPEGRGRRPLGRVAVQPGQLDLHGHLLRDALRGDHVHRLRDRGEPRGGDRPSRNARSRSLSSRASSSSAIFYVIVSYGLLAAFGFDIAAFLDLANFPPLYAASADPEFGGTSRSWSSGWSCSTSPRSASAPRRARAAATSRSAATAACPASSPA